MHGPLKANRPDVIDERFDGEVVLVDLRSGNYFSLNPAASQIWSVLAPGCDVEHAAVALADGQGVVAAFTQRLCDEGLLVAAEATTSPGPDVAGPLTGTPELERFDDVQDLLALDPIHDIDLDGDGWPTRPTAA